MQSITNEPGRPLRIAYLAAGAAGMYCGSCLRDNRVAATLLAQGRDVVLIPLYTPLKTDEQNVSRPTVYYGGISVYLEQRSRLFRKLPVRFGRQLDAPALLKRMEGWASGVRPEDLGPLTVSVLRGELGAQKRETAKLIDGLRAIRPSLVHLPNLPFVGVAEAIRRELGVPVFCTLSGEDIFLDAIPEPHRTEAFRLIRACDTYVDGYVAVTKYYADFAAEHFGLPRDKVSEVSMGIAVDDFAEPEPERMLEAPTEAATVWGGAGKPFTIGYLARICPAKGLHNLCEALMLLRREGRNCRILAAGYLAGMDKPYLEGVRRGLSRAGMADAFEYLGEVSREQKLNLLRSVQALSVPTEYHEAKGLFILEALAAGVPVVEPAHGSFPELIEATGGGLLYEPSGFTDVDARRLADALARLMDDESFRRRLGESGRAAVREKFSDVRMASETWAIYERYFAEHAGTSEAL